MTGRELYEMYADAMCKQNTGVDEWGDLEERDQLAWDAVAQQVRPA